jgi:hypothetical protein
MRCWRRGTKNERPRLGAHAELTPWDAIQGDFDPDSRSLLCEVFIDDAAVATWQAVLDTISSRDPRATFRIDPDRHPKPDTTSVEALLDEIPAGWSWSMHFDVLGFDFDLYAFSPVEVLLATGMDELTSEDRFNELISFVAELAEATERAVFVGGEAFSTATPPSPTLVAVACGGEGAAVSCAGIRVVMDYGNARADRHGRYRQRPDMDLHSCGWYGRNGTRLRIRA